MQVGVTYSEAVSNSSTIGYYGYGPAAARPYAYFAINEHLREKWLSISPLIRYTLTRKPHHRFQADALGGLTYLRHTYYQQYHRTDTDSTQTVSVTTNRDTRNPYNHLYLTAGVGVRYRFGRHLETLFDFTLHRNLLAADANTIISSGMALGLRYRFGQPL